MNNRDNFSQKTKDIIASRVGYKCSFPGCDKQTVGPHTDINKTVSVGVAAHISAAAPGGPRYDPYMTEDERKSPENGIWLCETHATLIDKDPNKYTIAVLQSYKCAAEQIQKNILNGNISQNVNGNLDTASNQKALMEVNKAFLQLHSVYEALYVYYEHNLERYGDFIEINNKIMDYWSLHGETLSSYAEAMEQARNVLDEKLLDYDLVLSNILKNKIDMYKRISYFIYQSDGKVGLYNNYYEKLFEMLAKNWNKMQELYGTITAQIQCDYKGSC